ncbi:hypothetical protein LCGC14_0327200 [marine sediment metagenome]|uniref:Uncharacterized protein n=1 Tax=marine sediment metagenome TaxID=412755 RepID=A0A0F9WPI1_9ZZZZ
MTLLIITIIWLGLSPPYAVQDHITFVLETTQAECEEMRREAEAAWADNPVGIRTWAWCVKP